MKSQLSILCALLVLVVVCGAAYGQSSSNVNAAQPSNATPSNVGAGPGMQGSSAVIVPSMNTPSTGVAVDNNFVYVLQNGKLYKYAKSDVNECGTAVPPPCQPCPPCGAGPACSTCPGMAYIPGFPSSTCTVTTVTPCVPVCPTPGTTGAGPGCSTCPPAPCPTPSAFVKCTPNMPAPCQECPQTTCNSCNPCAPAPTAVCNTCTTQCAGAGAGACPPVAAVSANAQATVCCLQGLCGVEADKAYLQAMIQLNQAELALSNVTTPHLGTTKLQGYGTNSIADSRARIRQAQDYLKDKYCLTVTSCPPGLTPNLNICNLNYPGKEFDQAYVNQLVQYYVDEIALSQVEIQNGLDCQVKAFAAKTIHDNQFKINDLKRCSVCF